MTSNDNQSKQELSLMEQMDLTTVMGEGEPPVKGAIPCLTWRDEKGELRIRLCRSHEGKGWVYTPVADGWVIITRHEEEEEKEE